MYKEDEETDKRNYLGISLLSAPGKLMESTETSTPDVLAPFPLILCSVNSPSGVETFFYTTRVQDSLRKTWNTFKVSIIRGNRGWVCHVSW